MMFCEIAETYLNSRKHKLSIKKLSPQTYSVDCYRTGLLCRELRGFNIRQINLSVIEARVFQRHNLGPASRNRYRVILSQIFELAIRSGAYRAPNPIAELPVESESVKTRKVDFWRTVDELESYIQAMTSYGAVYGVGAMILILAGCRVTELLGLKFSDVEWEDSYIKVQRIVCRLVGPSLRTKGQRWGGHYNVILVGRLKQRLRDWQKESGATDSDYVLRVPGTKRPLTYSRFARAHKVAIASAGLKRITPHDLRRTFATHAKRAGFHRSEIQEMLGHECPTTVDDYLGKDIGYLAEKAKRVRFGT